MESLLYSLLAGVATALGALVILVLGQPGERSLSTFLGFAGGIMIAISLFDLLPEALELGSMSSAIGGFLLGAGMMYLMDSLIPHAHMSPPDQLDIENEDREIPFNSKIKRTGYLIFFGIAIHNLPEGIAIGAGLEASPELGAYIALAIGLHNVPEGMAVAGPLRSGGLPFGKVFALALFAGLMTPVGTALGLLLLGISSALVSGGLAFAAGAMIYIVNDELTPQAHQLNSHLATAGLLAGLLLGFWLTH